MKIQFAISIYQLAFVNETLADFLNGNINSHPKAVKASYCLLMEVAEKVLKKGIDNRLALKPFKMTLKYYQAYYLHQFLLTHIDNEQTEKRRVIREVLAILNQKLT